MAEILNLQRANPDSVRNLVVAVQALGGSAPAEDVLPMMYLGPAPDHWRESLEAAERMGFLTTFDEVLTVSTDSVDDWPKAFPAALRRALRRLEQAGGDDAILYQAFRACLAAPLNDVGAVTVESHVNEVIRRHGQGEFNTTKATRWRDWMRAAGLGHTLGSAFSPVPLRALADICTARAGNASTLGEFLEAVEEDFPPTPEPAAGSTAVPPGTTVALFALQDDGVIKLQLRNDAQRRWTLAEGPVVSHLEILTGGPA